MKNQKDVKAILLLLADKSPQSIDDLMIAAKLPRTNIAAVMKVAVEPGLIERNADDLTRAPIYSITQAGRDFLARAAGNRLPKLPTAPAEAPMDDALRLAERQRDDHFEELEATRADLQLANNRIGDLQDEVERRGTKIQEQEEQIAKLQSEAKYREGVIAQYRDEYEQRGKYPFYVSVGRKLEAKIHKDIEVATRRIQSLVKSGDRESFVLVPIRKAVKGVEVQEMKGGKTMEARAA